MATASSSNTGDPQGVARRLQKCQSVSLRGNRRLNYASEHWTHPDENPPIGLILCAEHRSGVARYALDGLPNKVLAAEYRMTLPSEEALAAELTRSRRLLEGRGTRGTRKGRPGRETD